MNPTPIDLSVHHQPKDLSDRVAYGFTKLCRWTADTYDKAGSTCFAGFRLARLSAGTRCFRNLVMRSLT